MNEYRSADPFEQFGEWWRRHRSRVWPTVAAIGPVSALPAFEAIGDSLSGLAPAQHKLAV